ncbi:MAG TPA: hypothetical protein VGR73_23800 [Bryobacteraceae bacterium]|nr:hypothetical protein [Bryobacteraceae bacterium]
MRNIYIASIIVLAGLAGSFLNPGGSQSTPPTQSQGIAPSSGVTAAAGQRSQSKKKQEEGPYQILCEGRSSVRPTATANLQGNVTVKDANSGSTLLSATVSAPANVPAPESCGELYPDYSPLDVIIAFVPDPYQTRLRLQFDQTIEALIWATQDSGLNFRDSWLPWKVRDDEFTTYTDRKMYEEEQEGLRQKPGVLVFSGGSGSRRLAILLVGESPTKAFDRAQFERALDYWKDLQRVQFAKQSVSRKYGTVRVVGPCYSGTFDPLPAAIASYTKRQAPDSDQKLSFNILSGTATNRNSQLKFVASLPLGSSYHALLHTDSVQKQLYESHAGEIDPAGRSRALLSEDETTFGAGFRNFLGAAIGADQEYRFPRGIAYLRNAYQEDPGLVNLSIQQSGTSRHTLQLNLKNQQDGHDSIQEFADQSPVESESQLQWIADSLRHQRLQQAEIAATDTLDALFIARYLRTAAPDTRLVFFDADLLAARYSDYPPLNGTLEVTTYPLFPGQLRWLTRAPESKPRRAFGSQFEEGIFHATNATIRAPALAEDFRLSADRAADPPLWLTVIGNDGMWPLAILNKEKTIDEPNLVLPAGGPILDVTGEKAEPPLISWLILFALGFVGGVAYILVLWWAQPSNRQWCNELALRTDPASRAFYILCLTLSLAAAWLTLASGPIGYFLASRSGVWWINGLCALTATAASLMMLAALRLWWIGFSGSRARRTLTFAPWVLFAAYVAMLRAVLRPAQFGRSFFYSYRSVEIASGVSPMVPLLFLFFALTVWSFVHLQRTLFAGERYQLLPNIFTGNQAAGDTTATKRELDQLVERARPAHWFDAILASALAVAVFGFMQVRVRSMEGVAYDLYYALGVGIVAGLLCLTALRFWRAWRVLRRFLEQLELHPIRYAFSALPSEYSWAIWQHSPRKRSYLLLSRAVDCLKQWRSESEGLPSVVETDLQIAAQVLLGLVAQSDRIPDSTYANVQDALMRNADCFVESLKDGAWSQGGSDTLDKAKLSRLPSILETLAQEFVALRFVAYIRYVMLHLKNLMTFIIFGYVLVALSLGSYPFDSPHMVAWILVAGLFVVGIPVMWVILEMERDATLSRITDSTPGELNGIGSYARIASAGALPLLSVLASHFPSIGQYVFSWLQPLLRTVH